MTLAAVVVRSSTVNSTRLARFDDQISRALSDTERIDFFRDVVAHYVAEYDVPEVDVAAALAASAQGEEPLLLDPESTPEPAPAAAPDRPDRSTRGGGKPRFARYKIQVGKKHRVEPRQIVGAIANEGGLRHTDFGTIQIMPGFSVVELPADLSDEVFQRLRDTRIAGRPIRLSRDQGSSGGSKKKHRKGG